MSSKLPILVANNLSIGYSEGNRTVFKNLNISAETGEMVALIGRNGVGKSTLLRTLAGLQPTLMGEVVLNGRNIRNLKRNNKAQLVSYVPAESVIVPNLSVRNFVSMGRYPYAGWANSLNSTDWQIVDRAITDVGIEPLVHRNLESVSDGERHRAMIAFALAQDTKIILLDEPTAFLDLPNKFEMVRLLTQLAHSKQKLIIYSTHDLQVALNEVDSFWLMNASSFAMGIPEDLVLNGQLESMLFDSQVVFDYSSGIFKNKRFLSRSIGLNGEGVCFDWTKRMLERIGYSVNEGTESDKVINCSFVNGAYSWNLYDKNQFIKTCTSLSQIIALVK